MNDCRKEGEVPCYRVALLGPYGSGNLGDAAIQEAVMQNLRQHLRAVEFWGVSASPADTMERHGIQAFPISRQASASHIDLRPRQPVKDIAVSEKTAIRDRRSSAIAKLVRRMRCILQEMSFMVKAFRFLKGIDVLIFSGGGQLDDYWGGAWAHPFTLLKWTLLARLAGIKVAFFGVGVDSLTSSLSKCFLRWALRLAHFRSYRDERTRHFVRELGWNNDDQVHPDLAYGLSVETFRNSERNAAEYGLVIGVSPISASAWTKKDSPQYEAYLSMLGEFATWLVEEKHRVLLFPSQVTMDQPCLQQLVADIKKRGTPLDRVTVVSGEKLTLEDMLSAVSKTDIVVASRLHGIILSSLLFKPVLALSYSKKVAVQMRDLGLEAYSIDLEHIKLEMVKKVFLQLYSERQAIAGQLASRVHENRSWLEFQYTQRLLPAVALQE